MIVNEKFAPFSIRVSSLSKLSPIESHVSYNRRSIKVKQNFIKMMGSYYYYDTSYVEEVPAELHIHDCMWSGECYTCQPARVTFSNSAAIQQHQHQHQHQHQQSMSAQASIPGAYGSVPITVGGPATGGYITLTATARQETPTKRLVWPDKGAVPVKIEEKCQLERAQLEVDDPEEDEVIVGIEDDSPDSSAQSTPICSPKIQRAATGAAAAATEKPAGRVKRTNKGSNHSSSSSSSSSDNKKLRHREVEKNRHRQLQAMVKTLSEKIPGRLDKETQVQTMKRAARYCVYLRDVVSILSHQGQSVTLSERLEKSYLRSCDYVQGVHSD